MVISTIIIDCTAMNPSNPLVIEALDMYVGLIDACGVDLLVESVNACIGVTS